MNALRVGIIGAGGIAEKMAYTLLKMPDARATAVAARSKEKAVAFAKRHGIAAAHGSYADLAADPNVDLVYIATPNSYHYEHCLLCLEHGKHVLCEKPFGIDSAQVRVVFEKAKSSGLFAGEAMWTRFLPLMTQVQNHVKDGVIGKLHFLSANMGNDVQQLQRIHDRSLGGGALYDLGIYALNFAATFIEEKPATMVSSCTRYGTFVDAQNSTVFTYPSGIIATLSSSITAGTDKNGILCGGDGYIIVEKINNPTAANYYTPAGELRMTLTPPPQITGLEYEITAAGEAIRSGQCECAQMRHQDTVELIEQMENIVEVWRMNNI